MTPLPNDDKFRDRRRAGLCFRFGCCAKLVLLALALTPGSALMACFVLAVFGFGRYGARVHFSVPTKTPAVPVDRMARGFLFVGLGDVAMLACPSLPIGF